MPIRNFPRNARENSIAVTRKSWISRVNQPATLFAHCEGGADVSGGYIGGFAGVPPGGTGAYCVGGPPAFGAIPVVAPPAGVCVAPVAGVAPAAAPAPGAATPFCWLAAGPP